MQETCNKYASNIHAQYANNMQYAKKYTTCKICKIKHLFWNVIQDLMNK